jgi:hypothetical protein
MLLVTELGPTELETINDTDFEPAVANVAAGGVFTFAFAGVPPPKVHCQVAGEPVEVSVNVTGVPG